jgi:4-hydroxy 2-oxovalerate aldolase
MATSSNAVEILDCTLRDGSYAVDFRFTEDTIRSVLTGLEASGVRLVELGHGLGLGAGAALGKPTLVPDERSFELAAESLRRADWGMFCIPGMATPSHLKRAAAAGMRFVRVGVDITDVAPAEQFVGLAKDLGLRAFTNLMKTNVLGVDGVVTAAQRCTKYGADGVYLVDSVGGYLPHQVADLFDAVREALGITLGFHGHDNLGLANANALAAAGNGAAFVDTTLDGIGRGAGNTVTESFAAILAGRDAAVAYDYRRLARLSETVIRPLARLHDDREYQLVGSLTRTHSSFFPLITRCADATGVDVFALMAAVAEVERVNPTEALVMATAARLVTR